MDPDQDAVGRGPRRQYQTIQSPEPRGVPEGHGVAAHGRRPTEETKVGENAFAIVLTATLTGVRTGSGRSRNEHCRMENDPSSSVVNKYHRAHDVPNVFIDVPNLFIVDGSTLVTGGRNHPTM